MESGAEQPICDALRQFQDSHVLLLIWWKTKTRMDMDWVGEFLRHIRVKLFIGGHPKSGPRGGGGGGRGLGGVTKMSSLVIKRQPHWDKTGTTLG